MNFTLYFLEPGEEQIQRYATQASSHHFKGAHRALKNIIKKTRMTTTRVHRNSCFSFSSAATSSSSSSSPVSRATSRHKVVTTITACWGGRRIKKRRRSADEKTSFVVANGSFEEGMMQLTSDDIFIQSCAPWGNLCVSWGTKYVPIGVPSILASLLLFVPLFVALAKIRELEKENFRLKDEMEEAYKQRER